MRLALFALIALVSSCSPALANHLDLSRPANVTFACESADSVVRLILAQDDTETDAVLAGAECFSFGGGVLSRILKYVTDAVDPREGKTMEVYEIETIYGDVMFTYIVKPGIAA